MIDAQILLKGRDVSTWSLKIVGNVHSIDGLNAVEVDAIDKADVTVGALDEEVIKDM